MVWGMVLHGRSGTNPMSLDPKYKFDFDAFIRGILEFPNDYFRREVFADWMEERDEEDFANTIRAGFELHRAIDSGANTGSIKIKELKNTARGWWSDSETDRLRLYGKTEGKTNYLLLYSTKLDLPPPISFGDHALVDRGFISELNCRKESFWHYGKDYFSRHPITKVTITDFEPREHSQGFVYGCSARIRFLPQWEEEHDSSTIPVPWPVIGSDWLIEATTDTELNEAVSDYLVDYQRKILNLSRLFSHKYPNGRGTWFETILDDMYQEGIYP